MSGVGEELEEAGKMSLMGFYAFLYTILGNFQQQETEHPNIDWEGRRAERREFPSEFSAVKV